MRDVDPDIIYRALLEAENEIFNAPEKQKVPLLWVDRLLADDMTDVEAFLSEHPGLEHERQRLKQLIRNIKKCKIRP